MSPFFRGIVRPLPRQPRLWSTNPRLNPTLAKEDVCLNQRAPLSEKTSPPPPPVDIDITADGGLYGRPIVPEEKTTTLAPADGGPAHATAASEDRGPDWPLPAVGPAGELEDAPPPAGKVRKHRDSGAVMEGSPVADVPKVTARADVTPVQDLTMALDAAFQTHPETPLGTAPAEKLGSDEAGGESRADGDQLAAGPTPPSVSDRHLDVEGASKMQVEVAV